MYKVSKVGCKNIHLHANYKYTELKNHSVVETRQETRHFSQLQHYREKLLIHFF